MWGRVGRHIDRGKENDVRSEKQTSSDKLILTHGLSIKGCVRGCARGLLAMVFFTRPALLGMVPSLLNAQVQYHGAGFCVYACVHVCACVMLKCVCECVLV